MKKLSQEEKVNALTNFLRNVSTNEELFIYSVNLGKNTKFCVAEKSEPSGVNPKSNFMTYEEMNCYFFGVLAVKENRVNFNIEKPKETDALTDAINNVTEEIFNSIEHGQEITLNEEYHLYKYSEEDIISIYKTETDEEIIQVLSNGKGSFEFESLI